MLLYLTLHNLELRLSSREILKEYSIRASAFQKIFYGGVKASLYVIFFCVCISIL